MLIINGQKVEKEITLIDPGIEGAASFTDGTDTSIIKHVQEPGLGGRLTIGLDETARTMVICDIGDVDTDLGLSALSEPTLKIFDNTISDNIEIKQGNLVFNTDDIANITYDDRLKLKMTKDLPGGDSIIISPTSAAVELVDTNGEQSMLFIAHNINQSGTAAYNGLKIDVTETALGDGSTGDGNNLLNLQVGSVTKAKIDNVGRLVLAESSDPAALADHAFLYAKDVGGTGNMFVADAVADATQISPHSFELFTPDASERYPWSYYSENKALGVRINVDMAGAIREIEKLSGKQFIFYEDIEITQDLEVQQIEQFKREYIKENTVEIEFTNEDAFETIEEDERVLYDVEVVENGTLTIVKQGKKLSEKIVGYELSGTEVTPKIEIVWETKKVGKPHLKEDVKFNETDGKFYQKVRPSQIDIDLAVENDFVFQAPQWIKDRL